LKLSAFSKLTLTATLLTLQVLFATPVVANTQDSKADLLVARVLQAYGGDQLGALTSLQVEDSYKVFSLDQGANPAVNEVTNLTSRLNVDFKSNKKNVKNWRQGPNGNSLSQILFDGSTGWSINHLRGTHVENPSLTADRVGSGMLKMIDTVLALWLYQNRASASWHAEKLVAGKSVSTLAFETKNKEQYFLDIEVSTGLILRMSRSLDSSSGPVYEFSQHTKVQDLTFATDMNMLIDGKPRFVTTQRDIEINSLEPDAFSIPDKSVKLKGMLNPDIMQVQKLAEKVYLAGKGRNFSIFVDAGYYWVGAGGLTGITQRLTAVNQYLNVEKSLHMQILPDHHRGHLGALPELIELGSQLVFAAQHESIIDKLAEVTDSNQKLVVTSEKLSLLKGLVEVYDITTAHAENYLLVYIPHAKLVFSADHFGTNLIDALPGGNNTIKTFHSEITRLNLDVAQFAHAHGPRLLTATDLEQVVTHYKPKTCPLDEALCRS